ncbi:MAG: hypothetical protein ND895_25940 [Pyrinomonadaceae bacterium]|nr:hypothetical protein [Pyrinomonadaceae bacterium]
MDKNYSSTDHSAEFDRALSLPHFDEEATLLSARPVVPLNEAKVDTRSQRRVILGLTILVAILAGAIGATLMMPSAENSRRAVESEVTQPTLSSSGAAGGSTSVPDEARGPFATELLAEPQMEEVPGSRDSSIKRRQTAAISHSSIKPTISRSALKPVRTDDETAEDFNSDERELRRAERRDARREARRQLRQRREQMGDDVLRIREIFEGPPRP